MMSWLIAVTAILGSLFLSPISRATTTQTLWSANNQYGQGQVYDETSASGVVTQHMVFTGHDGKTIQSVSSQGSSTTTFPTGSVTNTRLANGVVSVQISVSTPGCGYPSGSVTVKFGPLGNPLSDPQDQQLSQELQQSLWCSAGSAQTELRSFANLAGINTGTIINNWESANPHGPGGIARPSQGVGENGITDGGADCGIALAGEAVSAAAWVVAPYDPLAYWGFAIAYSSAVTYC
jgi:hypothetical protein